MGIFKAAVEVVNEYLTCPTVRIGTILPAIDNGK